MTDWNDKLLTSGSAFVAYRLMVEGWPHEWVSDPRITHNVGLDFRLTYPGLAYDGLRISEQMVLREAWPQVSGITAKIVPTDANEDTLNSFTRDPKVIASLKNAIAAGDTTWETRPPLTGPGICHLGSECVLMANDGTTITRAYWDTEAQDHDTSEGTTDNPVPIYNWPPTMEGRRAYLFAYGPNDDPDSDGQIIWRGVVARPPRMDTDGVSWNIEIAPITKKFDQNLGSADEIEYKLRGVYHSSSCPMVWSLITLDTGASELDQLVRVYGFYETQNDFAAAVNASVATALATATGNAATIQSIVMDYNNPQGKYSFSFRLDAGYDDFPLRMNVWDVLDGDTLDNGGAGDPQPNGSPPFSGFAHYFAGDATGNFFIGFTGSKLPPWGYPLPLARTLVGRPTYLDVTPSFQRFIATYYSVDDPTWPNNRVYLEQVDGLSTGDVLVVKNGDDHRLLRITGVETSFRYIEVEIVGSGTNGVYISSDSQIVPLRVYSNDGNWVDFIEGIVAQSHAANLGKTPWITGADVDTSAWAGYWDNNYPFHDYWRHRSYRFEKQVRVRDVFAPELMVTGWMARLALDGRLDVVQMPFIAGQRSAQWTLNDDDILLPSDELVGMFPTWEAQADGLVNIAKVRLGYDPITDDFDKSGDYTIRLTQSIAEHKSGDKAAQTIEVRSQSATFPLRSIPFFNGRLVYLFGFVTITAKDVIDMMMPYLRALSTDYAIVTVAVPFTKFPILVGDIVSVTSEYIPDGFGLRGVSGKKAICLGRTWNLDPSSGHQMGLLTLWFARDSGRVAGYAPTGRVGTKTDLGGDSWNLAFSAASSRNIRWAESPDGLVLRHFAVDDAIQLVEVDSLTPTIVEGTITALVDDTHCIVQLADTWVPTGLTWNMRFVFDPEGLSATQRQAAYCWVASAEGEYLQGAFASDFPTAREFV